MDNDIVIYQSVDGQTKIDVRFENETFGSRSNRWPNSFILQELMWWNISNIFMKKVNWSKVQPVGISDKFVRKYHQQTLSPVEKAYMEAIKQLVEKSSVKK